MEKFLHTSGIILIKVTGPLVPLVKGTCIFRARILKKNKRKIILIDPVGFLQLQILGPNNK